MATESSHPPLRALPPIAARYHARVARVGLGAWGLTLGLATVGAFVLSFTFPANFDFWWHLAAGRAFWESGLLPSRDLFSFTAAGRPWIEHSWALEALMYGLYRLFGMAGPAALYGAAFAGMMLLSANTLRRMGLQARTAGLALTLLLPIFLPYIGPRPQVFGFLLFAALIAVVERTTRTSSRWAWSIPVLFLVWANVHGSYIIGLGYLALVVACELGASRLTWTGDVRVSPARRRRLILILGLSVLAIAVNPAGPRLWLYPFSKLGNPWLQYIMEWKPTPVSDPRFWPYMLLAGGVLLLVMVRRPRLALSDLVLTAGLCFAALYGRRFIPFASLWLIVMYGRVLTTAAGSGLGLAALSRGPDARQAGLVEPPRRTPRNLFVLGACVALAVVAARPPDPGARGRLPVTAVDALGAAGLKGPLFNDYNWGGYLIWRLSPNVRVFIDGRGDDLYMDGGVLPDYFRAVHLLEDPEPILDRYGIQQVLYRSGTPFVRYLRATGRWQVMYEHEGTVLLERSAGAP